MTVTKTNEDSEIETNEVSDSDKAAELAMNEKGTDETMVNETAIPLPENQYRVFKEIIKHPVDSSEFGENVYRIPRETPSVVFEDMKSAKTLLQDAKRKLINGKIFKKVGKPGAPNREVMVQLLNGNVTLREGGQGRRAGGPSKPIDASVPKARRGRPPATADNVETKAKTRVSKNIPQTMPKNGYITTDMIRAKVAQNPERIEKFLADIGKVAERYPDLFSAHFQLK
jgi:hypothetical protein